MYECTVRKRRVRAVLTGSESSAFPSAKLGTRYPPLCRLLRNRCTAAISADNAILDRHDDTGMAVLCFVNPGRGRARRQTSVSQSVSYFPVPPPPNQSQNHLTERYGTSGFARCGPLGFHPRAHFISYLAPSKLATGSRHVRRFKRAHSRTRDSSTQSQPEQRRGEHGAGP